MFNARLYENSLPDGIGVLEVVTSPGEGRQLFVPLKRSELSGEVMGPLCTLRLTQVYGYTREQCDRVLEAVYRFPLPGDAAVTGVVVRFGEVEIRAELKERQQAESDYQEARRQGKQAALATRESPDVFTLQVSGLQPDQEVRVETSYVQLARAQGPGYALRIPLTTAPRYVRSDESLSRHAHGQPLALLRDPGHRFALDLLFTGAGGVESATHALTVTVEDDRWHVRLRDGEVLPDRDCELNWRPRQEGERPALEVLAHLDPTSDQAYFLAQVTPPASYDPAEALPREIILLVDHSGSMEGAKWQATDLAVKDFLTRLSERDHFDLGLFHNTTRWVAPKPVKAEIATAVSAVRFLEEHRDSGGTELGVALEQALGLKRTAGDYARHVLIITDAQVSDEGRILRLAEEEALRADRRRISLLCIDAAPNSFLALELAERGGGTARFLTSSPEEGDVAAALSGILAEWSQPWAANTRLEVDREGAQVPGRQVGARREPQEADRGWSVVDLGDLPTDRPVWVAGRVPAGERPALSFRLCGAREAPASCRLDLSLGAPRPAIMALFGARQIVGLEFLMHSGRVQEEIEQRLVRLGYDPQQVLPGRPGTPRRVYAENVQKDLAESLRQLLVQEALRYGLACSETAFVAVRQERGKRVEGAAVVANALPDGWSSEFLSMGRGAGAPMPAASLGAAAPPALFAASMLRDAVNSRLRRHAAASPGAKRSQSGNSHLFAGVPPFSGGQALLFDSARGEDAGTLPDRPVAWVRLSVRSPDPAVQRARLDPGLRLEIYVGDMSAPRASLRLLELIGRQYDITGLGIRPAAGERVALVLVDANGAWAAGAPAIEIILLWEP